MARLVPSAVDRGNDVHVVPTVVRGAEVFLWWSYDARVGSIVCEHASSVGRLLPLNLLAFTA